MQVHVELISDRLCDRTVPAPDGTCRMSSLSPSVLPTRDTFMALVPRSIDICQADLKITLPNLPCDYGSRVVHVFLLQFGSYVETTREQEGCTTRHVAMSPNVTDRIIPVCEATM